MSKDKKNKQDITENTNEAEVMNESAEELEKLQKELAEKNDLFLRTAAEYDNYRKRTQKDLTERYQDAEVMVVKKLLPAIDNFERALSAESELYDDLKKGVEMIYRQILGVFDELGIKEFGASGDKFDPEIHNAVMHIEDESLSENEIVEVFEKGYSLGDRIVRHAMVKVAN